MKLLRQYVRREVALYAGVGLLLFTFVLFMQDLGRALEFTVRADSLAILSLVADVIPSALVFTLPMALLVGVLIGLGRLGLDNELGAMRACGVSSRRLLIPLLELCAAALVVALAMTLWLQPLAAGRLNALTSRLASSQLEAEVQPRVFVEPANNPNFVLYTGGTEKGGSNWKQVMVARTTGDAPPDITMAAAGQLLRPAANASQAADEVQLHLVQGAEYKLDASHPDTTLVTAFDSIDIPFAVPPPRISAPTLATLALGALVWRARWSSDWRSARIELYRRVALAFACLALAALGIPLGLRGGRGGKSGGFVLTLILVFSYYLIFIFGLGLAKQGRLPPFLGAWAANLVFFGAGIWALARLDHIPRAPVEGTDPVAWIRAALNRRSQRKEYRIAAAAPMQIERRWMPSLLEAYVVRTFLSYTTLLLAGLLLVVLIFTLFELSGSIFQNHIGLGVVLAYLAYFSPQMFYLLTPVAILVGVLITFGLMAKNNEITALKASGVSVYRLLLPVLSAALLLCTLQFALDATWLPRFNQEQDQLHSRIKGQPAQTYANPEHKWVFGQANDIYYFNYFDPGRREFGGVSVFEFNPQTFSLTTRIYARDARWDESIARWVFTDGWVRTFSQERESGFQRFQVASFDTLHETPAYFTTDVRQGSQMDYVELSRYIRTLRASGYDVARLSIALAKKVAYPLITVIMALLAFPFALSVGRRGRVAGLTVGIIVAISYWSSASLLEALGNLNQLPAGVAAWTPDALFLGLGMYLLLRVPT
jgi:LPS export ABC transporter permease LptG/LPS export ABC transporter permease LptF